MKKVTKKTSSTVQTKKTVKSQILTNKPIAKTPEKSEKKTVIKTEQKIVSKPNTKTTKPVAKTAKKTTAVKKIVSKKIMLNKQEKKPSGKHSFKNDNKTDNDSTENKPVYVNMGLPEGSAIQPTGQRRPLIVYPK